MGHQSAARGRARPCEQPFYMLMIHADGVVSACCADSPKGLVVGDLKSASHFRDILNGDPLRDLRRKVLEEDYSSLAQCRNCDAESVVDLELRHHRQTLLDLI